VSDDGRAAVQLGDGTQVDRESQDNLLTLAQTEVGGLDEYASGAEIHRLAKLTASPGTMM
jgi:hypothetical protein